MHLPKLSLIAWVVFVFNPAVFSLEIEVPAATLPEPVQERVSSLPVAVEIPLENPSEVPSWIASLETEPVAEEAPSSGGMSPEVRLMHLTVQTPEKAPVVLPNGRFVVSSVEWYAIGAKSVSSCSFLARHNLVSLLDAMSISPSWMAQGDANDLIRFGRFNGTLTSFTDKQLLVEALDVRKNEYMETVFDVYRFVATRSYALQSHRVAVFLGDDEEWYILDTIDGAKTTEPQLFRTYLENDVDAEWLVRIPWYSIMDLISEEDFQTALPYLSVELQVFFHTHYFDAPPVLADTRSISAEKVLFSLSEEPSQSREW